MTKAHPCCSAWPSAATEAEREAGVLAEEECMVQARSAIEGRTGPGHALAHGDFASSHQTTWPAGSWVGYQFQRVLSAATRNSPG